MEVRAGRRRAGPCVCPLPASNLGSCYVPERSPRNLIVCKTLLDGESTAGGIAGTRAVCSSKLEFE